MLTCPRWCSVSSDYMVCYLISPTNDETDLLVDLNSDMQTNPQDSYQHIILGYRVQRQLGPIKSTMDTTHYDCRGTPCPNQHVCTPLKCTSYPLPCILFSFFFSSRDFAALGAKRLSYTGTMCKDLLNSVMPAALHLQNVNHTGSETGTNKPLPGGRCISSKPSAMVKYIDCHGSCTPPAGAQPTSRY